MNNDQVVVKSIIQDLILMDVDGETMQYILKQVGMEDQMLRQLMLTMPMGSVEYLMEEKREIEHNRADMEAQDYDVFGKNKI